MKQRSSLRHARPPGFAQTLSKQVPRLPGTTNAQRRHLNQTPVIYLQKDLVVNIISMLSHKINLPLHI